MTAKGAPGYDGSLPQLLRIKLWSAAGWMFEHELPERVEPLWATGDPQSPEHQQYNASVPTVRMEPSNEYAEVGLAGGLVRSRSNRAWVHMRADIVVLTAVTNADPVRVELHTREPGGAEGGKLARVELHKIIGWTTDLPTVTWNRDVEQPVFISLHIGPRADGSVMRVEYDPA